MLVVAREGDGIVLKSQSSMLRELRSKVKARLKHPVTIDSYLEEKWAEANRKAATTDQKLRSLAR